MVSNTGTITIGGVASGLDVNLIIDQLTAITEQPALIAQSRAAVLQQRRDAIGSINSSLGTLLARVAALRDPTVVGARSTSVTTTTAQANALLASASSQAAIGSFSVDIDQLATATRAVSQSVIGQPVDAGVPLDEAGFDIPFVAGTFTINGTQFTIPAATATTEVSAAAVGAGVDLEATLDSAGLTITPAASGTFDINGTQINWDATVDSLNAIIARINGSDAGVTASYDTDTDTLTLTGDDTGPTAVTFADVSGNFLEAMNFVDGVGTPTAVETLGTDLQTLTDVINDINGAGIGVTATLTGGNFLQLSSGSAITVGSGGDSSNFLTATHLLESPAGSTRTSVQGLGAVQPNEALEDARLATALSASTGSFTVNGVTIRWDAAVDSLQNVVDRINQSEAGVTALYDAYNDVFTLTANTTGSSEITLADVGGNFLAAVDVLGTGAQTVGVNAQYRINGGATQYATTNTISDAVTGVTLTLRETTSTAVNVEVLADTNLVATRIQEFVEQYNSLVGQIETHTKFVEDGENGVLFGDGTMRRLAQRLRSIVTGAALGIDGDLNSLSSIGLTFGAVGSAVGSTDTLVFNRSVFDQAVADDPAGVRALLTAFEASASLETGGTGSIASISGTPKAAQSGGSYAITSDVLGNLTVTFTPDNGGTVVTQTGVITAGGTNSTLIPGVTLTAAATLVAGTDTITITAEKQGVSRTLHDFINVYSRTGGVLDGASDELQSRIEDINDQIDRIEARVQAQRDQLIRKFASLETTIARLQSQQQALTSMLAQLNTNSQQRNGNNNQ